MLKISLFLRNLQTSRANNSRILTIINAKFSGYYFFMDTNIKGDFQICISVPLRGQRTVARNFIYVELQLFEEQKIFFLENFGN